MDLKNLEPKEIWSHFSTLNAIPRASKKEEQVAAFMVDFGQKLGLETTQDKIGNVIIRKPASTGMENRKTVILQSHLDMVHQKNSQTVFDFDLEGIKMYVEADWVKAEGTTLGADNGIGVASIMGILASTGLVHPPLEALFTIDEETGMTGAKQLDGSLLNGKVLLNLDTESDDELTIGCAGGIDTNTKYVYKEAEVPAGYEALEIVISGLQGGHSGMDIHKGLANANKLMNRLLYKLIQETDTRISEVDGGSLRNAIPRESKAVIAYPAEQKLSILTGIKDFKRVIEEEYRQLEPGLKIESLTSPLPAKAAEPAEAAKMITALYAVANGVFRMSPDIKDLVEASSNLARVIIRSGEFITQSLQRSSVESTKTDVAYAVAAPFENLGAEVIRRGDYPGWKPNGESEILNLSARLYEELFKSKPNVNACHAGLECGILSSHLPGLDMISFGPNILGAHSPDERVQISSVQKFWGFLLALLKETPAEQ